MENPSKPKYWKETEQVETVKKNKLPNGSDKIADGVQCR